MLRSKLSTRNKVPHGEGNAERTDTDMHRPITMDRLNDEATFRSVVDATRAEPNGEVTSIERRIAAFEAEYQMSSEEMRAAVERGDLRPTRSVEAWLMALRVRDEFASAKARPR